MIRLNPELRDSDFRKLHPQILVIIADLYGYCLTRLDHYICITSMLRKKTNDSGVHQTGRAIDISVKGLQLVDIKYLLSYINLEYERTDSKPTAIYHDVGLGPHIHIGVQFTKAFEKQELANIEFCKNLASVH